MKKGFIIILILSVNVAKAQELFVYTEPASNMAAKSIGLRLNNYFMKDGQSGRINYHLLPEIMWGVSKHVMVHAEAFTSNGDGPFTVEGGSFYAKYRFFSIDGVHNHFRIAAYGRYSFNKSNIGQPAIDFNGRNSGYEGGLVATKLVNKVAVSASSSVLYANDNGSEKFLYGDKNRTAFNYTLSLGKLMLPKEYTGYGQTNMNLMLELLGQTTAGNGNTFIDIAPSVQFIVKSRMRVDIGYRSPLVKKLYRAAPRGCIVRLEYNIFNLY
ncbi:MAG: hypothetical protein ABIQ31_18145 [Ferruginibacter sp.]